MWNWYYMCKKVIMPDEDIIEEIDQKECICDDSSQKTQIEDIIDEASRDEFMKFIKENRKEIISILFNVD